MNKNFILVIILLEIIDAHKNLKGNTKTKSKIYNKSITQTKNMEFKIDHNKTYRFTIDNEKYLYSFKSEIKDVFFIKKENGSFESVSNKSFFMKNDTIYANLNKKSGKDIKVTISPTPVYNELNSIETIKENQYFFIESDKESMLYLDSFDRNSSIYINNKTFEENISEKDIKATGKYYLITPNNRYMVKIRIDSKDSISTVKKYFYPYNFDSINIKDDEQNFLYLKANKTYSLDFKNNTINIILKLSYDYLNSKINIKKDGNKNIIELNKSSPFYKLEKDIKGN